MMRFKLPSLVVVSFACVLAISCEPRPVAEGEGEGEDACPISADARGLLTETIDKLFVNGSWTILNTHGGQPPDLAYGASLVGLEDAVLQSATLAVPCTEPTTFAPSCETTLLPEGEPLPSPFFDEHDRCFRLGCSAEGLYFVDVYFVMRPNTLPEPRHEFTFALASPADALSTYPENPYLRWNMDITQADTVVDISADIDVAHQVLLADGTAVDASHSGTITGQYLVAVPDDEVTLDMTLAFANIAAGGAAVEVHGLSDGTLDGFITVNGEEVATLGGPVDLGSALPFAWRAGCE